MSLRRDTSGMDGRNYWTLLLISLWMVICIRNVTAQDSCHSCHLGTDKENCKDVFVTTVKVDDQMCTTFFKREELKKSLCGRYKDGATFYCEQDVTYYEFQCKINCPRPKPKQQPFTGGADSIRAAGGARLAVLTTLTWVLRRVL